MSRTREQNREYMREYRRFYARTSAKSARHHGLPWTPEDDAVVMAGHPLTTTARQLGRTVRAVEQRRYLLNRRQAPADGPQTAQQ